MQAQPAPQRFGRYVLLDRMGVGGMAEVFRAVVPGAEGFRRDLVVKRIASDRARAANFIEMFVHEARISALLHHPNVVQVFDFGQVDGSYFLAMELLRGRDLLAIFRSLRERRRSFPIPVAAHVAHQVALGLGYAHALTSPDGQPLNIVHRDVSPSNIMLLRTGGVKLLDFGIAQAIGEMDSEESERNSFKGKLSYMAPERLRDEPQDGRVDLFALGAVLWEMLAGRRLFHGKTEVEKLRSVLDRPIVAPSTVRPEVPAELDRIVLKALARDRENRYATAQEMADDLEDVVSETKYHSRMLPALLNDLFGSAPSSAHIALSALSPELMACDPVITPAQTPTISPASVALLEPSARGNVASAAEGELSERTVAEHTAQNAAAKAATRAVRADLGVRGGNGWKRGTKLLALLAVIGGAGTMAITLSSAPDALDARARRARFPAIDAMASTSASALTGEMPAEPIFAPPSASSGGLGQSPERGAPSVEAGPGGAATATANATATATATVPATGPAAAAAALSGSTAPMFQAISDALAVGGASSTVVATPARSTVRRVVRPRPPTPKSAASAGNGRITRGLSIDPFAEAATRGAKR